MGKKNLQGEDTKSAVLGAWQQFDIDPDQREVSRPCFSFSRGFASGSHRTSAWEWMR